MHTKRASSEHYGKPETRVAKRKTRRTTEKEQATNFKRLLVFSADSMRFKQGNLKPGNDSFGKTCGFPLSGCYVEKGVGRNGKNGPKCRVGKNNPEG